MPTVIVCPASVVENAWISDAKNFPQLKVVNGRANGRSKRKALIDGEYDIIVYNFESFRLHVADFAKRGIRRLIIDESSYLKNPDSQQTKACIALADFCDEVYLLSGTPAPNGEHEYYGQLRCIDRNEAGVNFYRWVQRWMYPLKMNVRGRDVIRGWRMREDKRRDFEAMLQRRAWVLRKEDCLSLPDKVFVDRWLDLGDSERKAYDSMLMTLRAEFDGKAIDASAAGRTMKLRQICGGWLYDEGREPVVVGQSKLDALDEVRDEIGGRPMIVWGIFQSDLDRLQSHFGDAARIVDGRTNIGHRPAIFAGFGRDYPILLAHPQACGHGVTLTQASYAVYYSLGFSLEQYLQSIDRIHRIGQASKCTYFRLLARGTIDEQIVKVLDRKLTAVDALRAVLAGGATDELVDQVMSRF